MFSSHSSLVSSRIIHLISERSRSLCVVVRPSVCRLSSVCNVRAPYRRLKFSAIFLRRWVPWPSINIQVKFYGDRHRETPPSGELNTRGVAEYSDFGNIGKDAR